MTNTTQDPRAALAKMDAEEKAVREAADKLMQENEKKRKELLDGLRAADLADVIEKCKLHGFTATDLKTGLKTKAARKTAARKTPARKNASRKKTAG
jgi:hypothetical protein